MAKSPVIFIANDVFWHGFMRVPKVCISAGADVVMMCRPGSVLAKSRYVTEVIEVEGTTEAFCASMIAHLREFKTRYDLVVIADDGLVREALRHDASEIGAWCPFEPDRAIVDFVTSKLCFMEQCTKIGVAVADFRICHDVADVQQQAVNFCFPLVAKAVYSAGGSGVRIIRTASDLPGIVTALGFPVAIQAFIDGQATSTSVLYDRGTPVCWSSSVQSNRWPHELGSITAKQLIEIPGIEVALRAIGKHTQFHGIACVDALIPRDGGEIVFCEINPVPAVEALSDHRVLAIFAAALARLIRGQSRVQVRSMPRDSAIVGLFPESFHFLRSNPGKWISWVAAFKSLKDAPYDDPALMRSMILDLLYPITPRIGLKRHLSKIRGRTDSTSGAREQLAHDRAA